jgi:hypothetical protein
MIAQYMSFSNTHRLYTGYEFTIISFAGTFGLFVLASLPLPTSCRTNQKNVSQVGLSVFEVK